MPCFCSFYWTTSHQFRQLTGWILAYEQMSSTLRHLAAPPVLLCSLAFSSHFGTRLFLIVSSWSESQAVLWMLWGARQADLLCMSSVLVRSFTQCSHLCQLLCKTLWMPATVTLGHNSLTFSLGEDRNKSMSARFPMDALLLKLEPISSLIKRFNHGKTTVVGVVHLLLA